ncbi:MAG: hypothetical protein WAP51_04670 [Candidatus Sungiibacteriota bacterium]
MRKLMAKSHEKGVSLALNTHGLFVRLRQRPLAQRRALFFATFVISGALVFSFWTNQMYRHFGIAFWGGAGSPEALTKTAEVTPDYEARGLKRPFEVARENSSLLKEEFMNLLSGISSGLEAAENDRALDPDAQKEPPVVALGAPAEQQNPPVAVAPLSLPASAKTESAPVVSAPTLSQNKNPDGKKPPLLVSADANQNQANSIVSGSGNSENNESKGEVPTEAPAINTEAKKTSRVVSIVMTNLASIRQAFSDFYEYLTQ